MSIKAPLGVLAEPLRLGTDVLGTVIDCRGYLL
jgi:hypothetical protein